MQSPFFSIIIPIYNVGPYLDTCLKSLCVQTESSWEGLCVDDGSTDDSAERLTQWLRADARLKATFQPNGGLSAARNRALPKATGLVVGFLDSDDAVAACWLEDTKQCFVQTQAEMVRFRSRIWRGQKQPCALQRPERHLLTDADAVQSWGWHIFVHEAFVWRYFLKRELAQQVQFPSSQRVKEDCVYGLRLLPKLTSVCDCTSALYFYRMRRTSLLHTYSPIDVPMQLLDAVKDFLRISVSDTLRPIQQRELAVLARKALTDWATRANPKERCRYDEVRHAFYAFMEADGLPLRTIFPWHWRPSVWCFLKFGWLLPMRVHSIGYRIFLKLTRRYG